VRRTGRQRKNISVFSKKDKRQEMKINETKNKQTGEASSLTVNQDGPPTLKLRWAVVRCSLGVSGFTC
jgi:hypothetical protein